MEAADVTDHVWKPASLHKMNVKANLVGIDSILIEVNHWVYFLVRFPASVLSFRLRGKGVEDKKGTVHTFDQVLNHVGFDSSRKL